MKPGSDTKTSLDLRPCLKYGSSMATLPHTCPRCNKKWPLPRSIFWAHNAPRDLLEHVPHTTQELVIVNQTFERESHEPKIPEEVFKTFTFAKQDSKRSLVEGIRYFKASSISTRVKCDALDDEKKDIPVRTDTASSDEGRSGYLRLVTLNNWYWSLLRAVISIIVFSFDLQANAMLSFSFLSDADLIEALGGLRFLFIFTWLSLLMVCFYVAYREASINWILKSNPAKGDLISNCSFSSQAWTFLAMVVFEFFMIEKDVTDIVIKLHPWKNMQDYSAFKCEGHRAFVVGYRSKTQHRAENCLSIWHCLPQQLVTKLCVMMLKIYLVYVLFTFDNEHQISYILMASTCVSCGTIVFDSMILKRTHIIRRRLYQKLMQRLQIGHPSGFQYKADIRALAHHFRKTWDAEKLHARPLEAHELHQADWVRHGHADAISSNSEQLYCMACGRASSEGNQASRGQLFHRHCFGCCCCRRRRGSLPHRVIPDIGASATEDIPQVSQTSGKHDAIDSDFQSQKSCVSQSSGDSEYEGAVHIPIHVEHLGSTTPQAPETAPVELRKFLEPPYDNSLLLVKSVSDIHVLNDTESASEPSPSNAPQNLCQEVPVGMLHNSHIRA